MGCHPAALLEVAAKFLLAMGVSFGKHSKNDCSTEASPDAGRVGSQANAAQSNAVSHMPLNIATVSRTLYTRKNGVGKRETPMTQKQMVQALWDQEHRIFRRLGKI